MQKVRLDTIGDDYATIAHLRGGVTVTVTEIRKNGSAVDS
jgi:hypothetical protein